MPKSVFVWLSAIVLAAVLSLVMTFSLLAADAQQQTMCGPIAEVLRVWKDRFKEEVVWGGTIAPQGQKPFEIVLTQSPAGTWTFIVIRGDIGCPVQSGNGGSPLITGRAA